MGTDDAIKSPVSPTHPIRALIVDLSHEFGGASSRALGLMSGFPAGQVGLAAISDSPVFRQAQKMGLRVHAVGAHKADWRILPNLLKVIRQNQYQVVDTQNIQSKLWASFAAWQTEVALVSTLNSWYRFEHGKSLKGALYTWLELLTNPGLDGYIVVSKTVCDALKKAEKKVPFIDLIYNAIGLSLEEIPGDSTWLKAKFDLPANAIVCSAVGRLVWAKGYEDLIDAIAQIASLEPALHCLIVGDGELRSLLQAKIEQSGLSGRIMLVGYLERDSVLSVLKASDFFVMPSRQEGTPIALLEAAAIGVPILATSSGGIPELVENGKQAVLVPPGDPAALASGLLELSQNPQRRQKLAAQAQAHVAEAFSLEAQVQATQSAYQKALEHQKSRKINILQRPN
jgi:glycosyltransferase involved in cell wall biosynthesis